MDLAEDGFRDQQSSRWASGSIVDQFQHVFDSKAFAAWFNRAERNGQISSEVIKNHEMWSLVSAMMMQEVHRRARDEGL